jgi:hypothetical protein
LQLGKEFYWRWIPFIDGKWWCKSVSLFKINTNFWKIKYTNTYMWLKDVRPEVTLERTYATKFMANHYLSWNISNRLNLGFFESVIWTNTNDRGFWCQFRQSNYILQISWVCLFGENWKCAIRLTFKYKWSDKVNVYGQFLDEFGRY